MKMPIVINVKCDNAIDGKKKKKEEGQTGIIPLWACPGAVMSVWHAHLVAERWPHSNALQVRLFTNKELRQPLASHVTLCHRDVLIQCWHVRLYTNVSKKN